MAKYDTYVLDVTLGDKSEVARLSLTVLFEVGDNIDSTIAAVRQKLLLEAQAMKTSGFLDNIKQ